MMTFKKVFYKDESFTLSYEEGYAEFHVHCDVEVWKLSTLKRLYVQIGEILDYAKSLGYREVFSVTPNPRFARLTGGVALDTTGVVQGLWVFYWKT